jgi:acyl-coenzyme A synthetase/AMP-(fatty) acid ligase
VSVARGADDVVAVRSDDRSWTYRDLRGDAFGLRRSVGSGETVTIASTDAGVVAAALEALDGWAGTVHLAGSGVDPATIVASRLIDVEMVPELASRAVSADPPSVTNWVLYTSGTTGAPKPIVHTAATLARTVSASARSAQLVWGLFYDPNRMAGIQVVLQALSVGSTVVATGPDVPLGERLRRFAAAGVNAVSATPTLWRRILQIPDVELDLEQVTLGGEIADQRVLDALAGRFPQARIVHIFASTETGAAFAVTDGREGFPSDYLESGPRGIDLEVREGVLFVHSPGVSAAGPDGFVSTGDLVEVVGDRVVFRGRSNGIVNVGGANVAPEAVEALLRRHPSVADVVVAARPNPMTGNVLVAQVVPADGVAADGLPKELRAWVRRNAPGTHVPATVTLVDRLEMSATGKAVR